MWPVAIVFSTLQQAFSLLPGLAQGCGLETLDHSSCFQPHLRSLLGRPWHLRPLASSCGTGAAVVLSCPGWLSYSVLSEVSWLLFLLLFSFSL